jgi:quinol monooxygenase YgiN
MTSNVYWLLVVNINDGKKEDFEALAKEMSDSTKQEEGALAYEWHLTGDNKQVHIYERYADSAATMVHLASFGANFAERFMTCVTPASFTVYGKADDTVKGALADLGPSFPTQFAGFTR